MKCFKIYCYKEKGERRQSLVLRKQKRVNVDTHLCSGYLQVNCSLTFLGNTVLKCVS